MEPFVQIHFHNEDAAEKDIYIECRKQDSANIILWYSAFYEGDLMTVKVKDL